MDLADLAGCSLLDGATNATLCGQRNEYCIAIDAPSPAQLARLRHALLLGDDPGLRPPDGRLLEDAVVGRQPLILAGRVTSSGDLIGYCGCGV